MARQFLRAVRRIVRIGWIGAIGACGGLFTMSLVMLGGTPLVARGGEVPASARASSLAIEPELLDGVALIFAYPQRAAAESSQVFALGTSGPHGAGGLARFAGGRLHLTSQWVQTIESRQYSGTAASASMRLGWGVHWKGWSAGVSAGGHLERHASGEESFYWRGGSDIDQALTLTNRNANTAELSAGIGRAGGRGAFDAAWTAIWEGYDSGALRRDDWYEDVDHLGTFASDQRPLHGFRVRGRWIPRPETEITAAGGWRGRRESTAVRLRGEIYGALIDSSGTVSAYRDDWSVLAAVARRVGDLDRVTVSAAYASSRVPLYNVRNYVDMERTSISRRYGSLAISVEEPLPRRFVARLGLQRVYTWEQSAIARLDPPNAHRLSSSRDETLSTRFRWGLGWSWRNFELNAQVAPTLSLYDAFSSLDLRLTL